jgi:toxin ParE1/3/4
MAKYKLSNVAKSDLIRIHQYGVEKFGVRKADEYFNNFFECFELISQRPFSYEAIDYIKKDYRKCKCGVDTIYFKLNDGDVEIMAIIGKQDIYNRL